MFRRTSMAFLLSAVAFAATAVAQPAPGLLVHQRVFQNREVHQVATMLQLPVPANGWATPAELRDAQVEASLDWLAEHGYLFDDPAVTVDLVSSGTGNSLVIRGPGFDLVIHLPSGPFLPTQREQLLAGTIVRQLPEISNGF